MEFAIVLNAELRTRRILGCIWQVLIRVWYPVEVRIIADDSTLNKFELPSLPDGSCTRALYQSTPVHVFADFGGEGLETIRNTDVSSIVSLSSTDPSVIQITEGIAQVTIVIRSMQHFVY